MLHARAVCFMIRPMNGAHAAADSFTVIQYVAPHALVAKHFSPAWAELLLHEETIHVNSLAVPVHAQIVSRAIFVEPVASC